MDESRTSKQKLFGDITANEVACSGVRELKTDAGVKGYSINGEIRSVSGSYRGITQL